MTSSQLVTWLLATVTAVIVPRFLGSETLGRFHLAGSLWGIAGVFTALGTSMYLQLAIARDQHDGLSLIAPVFVARTAAFVLASGVLAVYVALAENDPQFVTIMILTGVAALILLWSEIYSATFIGLERMSILAVIGAGGRLLALVATATVLLLGFGVYGVLGVGVGTATIGLAVLAWQFHRIDTIDMSRWRSHVRPVVTGSVSFMGVTLALMIYRQIDVIVISRVADIRDLGWYGAADLLTGSLLFPTTVVVSTLFPTFGRLHEEDPERLQQLVQRIFPVLLLAAVPIGLGAAVVGPTFAPLLFGDDFDGTGTALVVFGPVTVLSFGTTLFAYLALATDRTKFLTWLLVASAAVTIPLDAVLVPWASNRYDNGAVGGALAYVVTETFQFAVAITVIAPYLVTRAWAWRSLRILAAGGVMVVATLPLREQLFVVPALVGAVVYAIAVFVLRVIDDDQRRMVGEVLARAGLKTRWAP